MKRVKNWLRNYFGFSATETNGFLVLGALMCLLIFVPGIVSQLLPSYDPLPDKQKLQQLLQHMQTLQDSLAPAKPAAPKSYTIPAQPFNPNSTTTAEWVAMGLSPKIAQRIQNYKSKGGEFKVKEDLARIYDFPKELYEQLVPNLTLPDRQTYLLLKKNKYRPDKYQPKHFPNSYKKHKPALSAFDLNTADSLQLMLINGIGNKRAQRIIKYRSLLGGFVSETQLKEVYGLDASIIDSLQKYSFVSMGFKPQQLHINTATLNDLGRHPYLNFKLARAIISYRGQHGPYQRPEDLEKVRLLPPEVIAKLLPYISFAESR